MFEETVERRLRPLAEAFARSDLVRLRVADERSAIELRRAAPPSAAAPPAREAPVPYEVLTAELVGRVRLDPVVAEGLTVEAGRELGAIEALGLRTLLAAPAAGRIACVYVEDGQPVEYGQPLLAVEPRVP